jgi:hypothetical protein
MKLFAVLVLSLLLSGCASDAYVKIYQLGAEGGYGLIGDVVASGCLVYTKGIPEGLYISYHGKDCDVEFGSEVTDEEF